MSIEIDAAMSHASDIAKNIPKIKDQGFFDFDADYESSNSVDREFIAALKRKDDLNG